MSSEFMTTSSNRNGDWCKFMLPPPGISLFVGSFREKNANYYASAIKICLTLNKLQKKIHRTHAHSALILKPPVRRESLRHGL